jgi:pumilio homology domain family member 6
LAQERKAAKPLADQLVRTKKIWERLRRKSHVPVDERKQLVTELFEIITGRIKDFVLKHDSVRVVQTAIKYANPEQRLLIAGELSGTYRQLAESRYAKFLIGKLLVQGDDKIRDIIVPEFFGNVRRLIKHPEASWILDDVYRGVASRQQKAIILREWYGAEFALFEKDNTEKISGDLSDILAANPGKRAPIMRSLQELINHLIQKKMTGFTLLHDAMLQYFLNVKPGTEEITDYLELIKGDEEGDLLKNLAFTRSGSRVVCLALAYGTAKDRKQILKT